MRRPGRKRSYLFSIIAVFSICIGVGLFLWAYNAVPRRIGPTPYEPIAQMPSDEKLCIEMHNSTQGISFQGKKYLSPTCSNIVYEVAHGSWSERHYSNLEDDKKNYDKLYSKFRVEHEGFSASPFRKDGRCGFRYQQSPFHSHDASTWCHPASYKPCCSNVLSGICVAETECIEPKSVNLATFVHAEVSDWVLHNKRCQIVEYDQGTACALLHDKQVKSIGFIGNSLIRNIYSVMLQLLTNNYYNGSIMSCIAPSLREKCVNHWQNMDKFCLGAALAPTSKRLPGYGLCNGYLDTLLYQRGFWLANNGNDLKNHIMELLDKPGNYLIVGIGVHDRYNAKKVINEYLKPAFEALAGHKWPKFLWLHQLKSGIFKPPSYINMHGTDDDIDKYVEEIDRFCKEYNIPALDLRPLTTSVWSVDGTHYGRGVNLMKIQMFLNLLASDQVF